jgi:hypothetical protein
LKLREATLSLFINILTFTIVEVKVCYAMADVAILKHKDLDLVSLRVDRDFFRFKNICLAAMGSTF